MTVTQCPWCCFFTSKGKKKHGAGLTANNTPRHCRKVQYNDRLSLSEMPPHCITRGGSLLCFSHKTSMVPHDFKTQLRSVSRRSCAAFQDAAAQRFKTQLRSVSKFLGISERTLSNYLTGKSDPPRAIVYAIWHESPAGHAGNIPANYPVFRYQ